MTGSVRRSAPVVDSELEVKVLTPDRLDDLARSSFDQPGDPKWCWCASFRISGSVKARPPRPEPRGPDGTDGHRPVAGPPRLPRRGVWWPGSASRPATSYRKLARSDYPDDRAAGDVVWSIVCFVVDPTERGRGLARAMLAAAVDHAPGRWRHRRRGLRDRSERRTGPRPDGLLGPASRSSSDAGFRVVGERMAGRTRWPRPLVRLDL